MLSGRGGGGTAGVTVAEGMGAVTVVFFLVNDGEGGAVGSYEGVDGWSWGGFFLSATLLLLL